MKSSGRILIVDDEETWRHVLSTTLQRAGFQADVAGTISHAWALLRENVYDLAILDISMSPVDGSNDDGMQFLSQLDEGSFLSTMRVAMLSGYGTSERIRQAFRQHRVADFLSKDDFDPTLLVEEVQRILA